VLHGKGDPPTGSLVGMSLAPTRAASEKKLVSDELSSLAQADICTAAATVRLHGGSGATF